MSVRRLRLEDDGPRWIYVPPVWHAMDQRLEGFARSRYLAARGQAGCPPVQLAGETRAEAQSRLGGRDFPLDWAARFDPDPDVRQSTVFEMLEATRRSLVGDLDDRSWCRWADVSVTVVDERQWLISEGKLEPDVILDALERLREIGVPFGVTVTGRSCAITGAIEVPS